MHNHLTTSCNLEPIRAYIFECVNKFELLQTKKPDDTYRLCNVELTLMVETIKHCTALHYKLVADLTFFNCTNDEIKCKVSYMDGKWWYCVPYKDDARIGDFVFESVVDDLNGG